MLRTVGIVGVLLLSSATLALGQESVLGEYKARLRLGDGTRVQGQARIEWLDRRLELTLELEGRERQVLQGRELAAGRYLFAVPAASGDTPSLSAVGLAGRLELDGTSSPRRRVQVVRVDKRLPLRSEPNEDAPVVGHARPGQSFPVVAEHWTRHELEAYNHVWETRDWVQLELPNGRRAWAPSTFVLVTQTPVREDTTPEHSILLERSTRSRLQGVVRRGREVVGEVQLERIPRQRRALLSYGARFRDGGGTSKDRGEERAFLSYARDVARWYRTHKGFKSDIFRSKNAIHYAEKLEQAAAAGTRYDLLVIIGHGGWDGPTFGKDGSPMQVSGRDSDLADFQRFLAAIRVGTHPSARIFSSSCHAGGSDWVERGKDSWTEYNWVEDVALRTGRTVAGPAGLTSTEWTLRNVLASFEGVGTMRQEVHVASPDGLRIVRSGRTVSSARLGPLPHTAGVLDPSSYRLINAGDSVDGP